ncbi:EAL domain-containing protein [Salinisphaera sp. RV14]|uniref:EAL domain-containing protein n=1 Tax=unclassified Salinisphaera TaxID=2649847 RepID=UPI003F83073D
MTNCDGDDAPHCTRCGGALDFDFTMAFQPIVDVAAGDVFAYEALVRGPGGESAASILDRVDAGNMYTFDQACRVRAIEIAHALGCDRMLSINFLPNAVYAPEACIQATLATAERLGWPVSRLMFEIIETEAVRDRLHLQNIVEAYNAMGFTTALDDFGGGYANLDLLIDLRPEIIKLDRELVREIPHTPRRQALVEGMIAMAAKLDIRLIAEGVETAGEAAWLYRHGIALQQGYYFARPGLEQLPSVPPAHFSELEAQARMYAQPSR